MKKLIVITIALFLILLSVKFSRGQDLFPNTKVGNFLERSGVNKKWVKLQAVRSSLLIVSGCYDGSVEIVKHDYKAFKRKFPNANDDFFDPRISWKNKWKNKD